MLIIGIAGGTGSGKTTVVNEIVKCLPKDAVVKIPQDAYYRDNSHIPFEKRKEINFDHPSAIEFELLVDHVKKLKGNNPINLPIYSYITCTRSQDTHKVEPKEVIIVEGILVLTNPQLRKLFDIKVFVDAEPDVRLIRVIQRDIVERGRSVKDVLERYEKTLKPMHQQFIEPSKACADLIIPQGGKNRVAINVFATVLKDKLNQNGKLSDY